MPLVADPQNVPVGALAPYSLTYVVTSKKVDLTKVTAGRFVYRRAAGKGLQGSWAATLSNVQPRSITLTHLFAVGDVPDVDQIVFEPRLLTSLGAGEVVGATRTLYVVDHPTLER